MNTYPQKKYVIEISIPEVINHDQIKRVVPILFYVFLGLTGLVWVMLGNTWYAHILPFFDSLSYQTRTEMILRSYQENGWWNSVNLIGPNSFLYVPFFSTLAPIVPVTRTALYLYLIPLHLTALAILFNFIYNKTKSFALALLGPLLYLSTIPFGILQFGVLDQRFDLATASFAMLLWVVGLDWAEDYASTKKTLTLGVITAFAFLNRPMIAVQGSLVALMIVTYAVLLAKQDNQLKKMFRNLGIIAATAGLISLPWLVTNLEAFYNYYIINSPITGLASFSDTIPDYFHYISNWLGVKVLITTCILILAFILLGKFSWKYLCISLGIIFLPTIPLILSRSNFDVVAQICLAGIGVLPLAFYLPQKTDYGLRIVAVIITVTFAFSNLFTLARLVNTSNTQALLQVEALLTELVQKYPTEEPVFLSGFFISEVDGVDALASIARLELGYPLYPGVVRSHPHQFGLSSKEIEFSEEELEFAAVCGLQRAYNIGGILLLVDPDHINDKIVQEWIARGQANIFSNSLAARMTRIALEDGRVEDTEVTGTMGTVPVRFYMIKPGQGNISENCP